jgi:hypothetical protein
MRVDNGGWTALPMMARSRWYVTEKDDSSGAALPERVEEPINRGGAS